MELRELSHGHGRHAHVLAVESEGRHEEVDGDVRQRPVCPKHDEKRAGARGMEVGRAALAWLPRRHFIEHVSCNDMDGVGRVFGPCQGRIWTWTKNEVCQARPALHFWFKGHGH